MEFIDLQKLVKTNIEKFKKNFSRELHTNGDFPKELIYMNFYVETEEEREEASEMLLIFNPPLVEVNPDAIPKSDDWERKVFNLHLSSFYTKKSKKFRMLIAVLPFFTETKFSTQDEEVKE